jgi:hypothetical protein
LAVTSSNSDNVDNANLSTWGWYRSLKWSLFTDTPDGLLRVGAGDGTGSTAGFLVGDGVGGSIVGAEDTTDDGSGLSVGTSLGASLTVGVSEGPSVAVGLSDGWWVMVGLTLGRIEGPNVGSTDGSADGNILGSDVGSRDGPVEGMEEG